jgi:small-conductance mechanosensitive channel
VFGVSLILLALPLVVADPASAQAIPGIPSLPSTKKAETAKTPEGVIAAPTADNPEASAAEATGTIKVDDVVTDGKLAKTLESLLPRYPGVRTIQVEVEDGVVTLNGHVEDSDTRDRLRDFVRRVEGVKLVLNQTRTDAQVLGGRELASQTISHFFDIVSKKWLLWVLALGVVVIGAQLARLFNTYADQILRWFTDNQLLQAVIGSVISAVLFLTGLFLALTMLNLTEAVVSVVGLAGVAALAIGFAFRDIAENFIASVLLGLRRPFGVGDFIEVAGRSGVVRSLNTRATMLMTIEGHLVRIPNSTVFKEILVNKTASHRVCTTFDLILPYDVSTATSIEIITRVMRSQEGVMQDPPARTLVEGLEADGVRVRSYYWAASKGLDGLKLKNDINLAAKTALQAAGIAPSAPRTMLISVGGPVQVVQDTECDDLRQAASRKPNAENLRRDTIAAARASLESQASEPANSLGDVRPELLDEGENLLLRSKVEPGADSAADNDDPSGNEAAAEREEANTAATAAAGSSNGQAG